MAGGLTGVVRRFTGYDVVRIAVGLLLLTAAGLKAHQLATEPILGTGLLDSRWLLMAAVEFELLLGLCLLANLRPKLTWAVALACFGVFACLSLYKALSGDDTWGCFGRVPVNPWYTTLLDSAIVVLLLHWPPRGSQLTAPVWLNPLPVRVVAVFVIWLSVGIPAALAMWTPSVALLESDASVVAGRKFVVLKPEKWIGKRFPLLDFIDVGDGLKEGRWLVLLCRCDCPRCQHVVGDLPRITRALGIQQVAVIEMPNSKKATDLPACPAIAVARGRLSNAVEWFAELPSMSVLEKGKVLRASSGGSKSEGSPFASKNVQSECVHSHLSSLSASGS